MRLPDSGRYGHPKQRPSSLRFWPLDEAAALTAVDRIQGDVVADLSTGTHQPPAIVEGPTGKARRYLPGTGNSLTGAAAILESERIAILGDWTAGYQVRMRGLGNHSHFNVTGAQGDVDGTENFIFQAKTASSGAPQMFWEYEAGSNIGALTAAVYRLPLHEWTYVVWRKRDTTRNANGEAVVGGVAGGTCTVDLIINGQLVETWVGVINTGGGQTARWHLGGIWAAASNVLETPNVDLGGCYFWTDPLDITEIEQDVRRIHGHAFFTRAAVRVTVANQAGDEVDMSDLGGLDFVDGVSVTRELDQPTATASVSFLREQEKLSLATLLTNSLPNITDPGDPTSYSPFLELGSAVEAFFGRVPQGIEPTEKDWSSLFRGQIDEINEGGAEKSVVTCRDLGGRLIDAFIETERDYSDPDTPFAVEGEMQFLLDDNDNSGITGSYEPVTLLTPVSPSWSVLGWRQRREPVLSALRTLAGQIGGDVNYQFNKDVLDPGWRLTFALPLRQDPGAKTVLAPDDILDVTSMRRSILGVRNAVRVVYQSSELTIPTPPVPPAGITLVNGWQSTDGEGNRLTAYVELVDTASVARIGRRLFMEMAEASSSQIDTVAEAYDMAFGALSDLAEEDLAKSIKMALLPELELNDTVKLLASRQLYTVAQRLAVKSISHEFSEGGSTTLQLRGKPAVGQKRWLRLDTRPGGAKPAIIDPLESITDQALGTLLGGVRNFLDRTNYFQGGKFLALRNPNFQSFSNGMQNFPDGWQNTLDSWAGLITGGGSSGSMYVSDDSASGSWSVGIDSTDGLLQSDPIPVDLTDFSALGLEIVWKTTSVANDPRITLRWFDENMVPIEPYGATHSNRGIHPAIQNPSYNTLKNGRMTALTAALGGGLLSLRPAIVEAAQFAIGDIIDHTVDGAVGTQWDTRRGVVTAIVNGGAGDPQYTVDAPTETVPGAGSTGVDGCMTWRPPYWRVDSSAAAILANAWNTSRQTGIEPPSSAARYVVIQLGATSTSGDIRYDSISLFRVGRELRVTRPVPTNQTYAINQWSHTRHQSPSPGPYQTGASPSLFRGGLDYGNNYRTDGFPNGTLNLGTYFLCQEDGLLEVKAAFAIRRAAAGTQRVRLRVVRNGTYGNAAANYLAAAGNTVVSYGPWADSLQQMGLPLSGTALGILSDRVQVTRGDRITVEAYVESTSGLSCTLIQDPQLNFSHFKLFPNF